MARGVHGLLNPDIVHDLVEEQETSTLIGRALIYFFTTIAPYIFLASPLIFPSFFLVRTPDQKRSSPLLQNNVEGVNTSSGQEVRQTPNQFD